MPEHRQQRVQRPDGRHRQARQQGQPQPQQPPRHPPGDGRRRPRRGHAHHRPPQAGERPEAPGVDGAGRRQHQDDRGAGDQVTPVHPWRGPGVPPPGDSGPCNAQLRGGHLPGDDRHDRRVALFETTWPSRLPRPPPARGTSPRCPGPGARRRPDGAALAYAGPGPGNQALGTPAPWSTGWPHRRRRAGPRHRRPGRAAPSPPPPTPSSGGVEGLSPAQPPRAARPTTPGACTGPAPPRGCSDPAPELSTTSSRRLTTPTSTAHVRAPPGRCRRPRRLAPPRAPGRRGAGPRRPRLPLGAGTGLAPTAGGVPADPGGTAAGGRAGA